MNTNANINTEINYNIEIDDDNRDFGILKLNIPILKTELKNIKLNHILFSIDNSSSMGLKCEDGKTKLQYILFTLQNMLEMFIEKKLVISIHIIIFNNDVKICIPNTIITTNNINEVIEKILSIKPTGSTNIEQALNYASNHIGIYHNLYPEHDITHIFLTDGNANKGSTNINELKLLVPSKQDLDLIDLEKNITYQMNIGTLTNIFIGYGADHDVYLLNEIANKKTNYYFFIDKLEHAYLIYGEIIHNIIYKYISEVTIIIHNALIYNYRENTWSNELYIGDLVYGTDKIYQIEPLNDHKDISIQLEIKNNVYHNLLIKKSKSQSIKDLTKYIIRQQTQELLYKVKQHNIKNKPVYFNKFYDNLDLYSNTNPLTDPNPITKINPNLEREQLLKEELNNFLQKMLQYMQEQKLEEDPFMKMLYNDIYISHKLLGNKKACLYACSRHTSQGEQTGYSLNLFEDIKGVSEAKIPIDEMIFSPYTPKSMLDTWDYLK